MCAGHLLQNLSTPYSNVNRSALLELNRYMLWKLPFNIIPQNTLCTLCTIYQDYC